LFLRNRKQFLRSVDVYVVFWTFYICGRGKKCFRLNHLADPLQYLRGPPGGRGPPVEDLWFSAFIYRCTHTWSLFDTYIQLTHPITPRIVQYSEDITLINNCRMHINLYIPDDVISNTQFDPG